MYAITLAIPPRRLKWKAVFAPPPLVEVALGSRGDDAMGPTVKLGSRTQPRTVVEEHQPVRPYATLRSSTHSVAGSLTC